MWKLLINKAKLEWRVYLSVADAFPSSNHAKEVVITPIVQQIFQEFKRKGHRLESDFFPHYECELYTLIYNDASTFRSEIKKICVSLVPSLYDFMLPRKLKERDSVKWLKTRADELIDGAKFLHGLPNSKGIERNFAHAALYRLCAEVYDGKSQKQLGDTSEFKDAVPPGAVALISAGCVLRAISKHGNIQDLGKLCESVQAQEYERFHDMIGKVFEDRKGGRIFEDQLEKWARKARCGLERVLKQSGDDNEYALAPM
ncbi:hypothetical protein JVT61DRAFT_7358 [Boletus reticuloceps]|uniref:DUF6532 domain-containing protein n=1 Tax=Boletus reticuloceps TaxID=495285 RepID=A0A8I2YIW2_9AGAM|nr:hypothetical protein JVT61DRAFT_7358 [Boletus reticuloceps]